MIPAPDYSPDPTLTPQQHHIISLLAAGNSIAQAAAAENLHRNTLANWRRTIPAFARELEFALREQRLYWHEQATRLAPLAIQVIEETLTNPNASPSLRFRAAALIIKLATDPNAKALKTHDTLPAELAALDDQKRAWRKQIAAETASDAQSCTNASTPDDPEIFDIEQSAKISVDAQTCTKPQPIRVAPKPGRNEPCPCGSNLKFKRCCANNPAIPDFEALRRIA
jgi:uncharacterized protein YchJ